jgi:intracellular multiplication protein IcmS
MDIKQQLVAVSKSLRCNFTVRDQTVPPDQVFSETGFLPAIMRRADQLSSFCLGYSLGLTFEDSPGTTLGIRVKFDDKTPNCLRVMCATDIVIEFIQNAPSRSMTPIDNLLND